MAGVTASLSSMGYFLPIFAFLLVFIVVFAILKKTEVLGPYNGVALFVSFILASFFVVEASLVEFVQFSSAWFGVIIIGIFFIMMVMAFIPGDGFGPIGETIGGGWFGWVVLGVMVGLFIIASAYVFNWVVNWGLVRSWFDTDWFGMVLLLLVAGIVSFIIVKNS